MQIGSILDLSRHLFIYEDRYYKRTKSLAVSKSPTLVITYNKNQQTATSMRPIYQMIISLKLCIKCVLKVLEQRCGVQGT